MPSVLDKAVEDAIAEKDRQSRTADYKWNFPAWYEYMTGGQLWSKQVEIAQALEHDKNVAVKAGHGVGKALSLDTPLPTPTGWTTMGAVQVGDELIDEKGQPTRVIAKSAVWYEDTYEVTFDDGTSVVAAAQHEWAVVDLRHRPKHRRVADWRDEWAVTRTLETRELAENVQFNGQYRWRVPMNRALDLPENDLPIDPYVFGAWLGDGSSRSAQITTHPDDSQILERFRDAGYNVRKLSGKYRWSFADEGRFVESIRALGVFGNKHIPDSYLRGSIEQRRELLRGILDTDGHCDKRGVVTVDLASRQLSDGVVELARSLGCKVTVRERPMTLDGRVVGTRYRMALRTDFNPFFLDRKAKRWSPADRQASRHTQKTIVSVRRVDTVPTQCVQVSNDSHLFLAGRSMVPTHNSLLVSALIAWWVDTRYPHAFVASTAPSTAQIGAIVWRELRRLYDLIEKRYNAGEIDHKLPGSINKDNKNNEWKDNNGQLIGFGRKPPEGKEDDNFQGIHDAYVLAIGDEAVGLSKEMIDALGNITSNKESRRIIIANPTNPASYMGKIFRESNEAWRKFTISVFDSPNFTEERHNLHPDILAKLTDQSYVEDKKKEYGENSARYKARVLGEFAFDIGNALIQADDVSRAHDTEIQPSTETRPEMGVDVARFGDDKSVAYLYHDGHLRFLDSWEKAAGTETAARIDKLAKDNGVSVVKIDGSGLGGPIVDSVVALAGSYTVISMLGSGASPDKRRWYNARAFWWDDFRERLRNGKIDLDLEDETLADEAQSVEYKFAPTGALLIESKDDMRRRGFKSPDFADAAIYAAADVTPLLEDPLAGLEHGDIVMPDIDEFYGQRDFLGIW